MINPELVLKVARKVYPEKRWEIAKNPTRVQQVCGAHAPEHLMIYAPNENTNMGKAQLMDLVFSMNEKISEKELMERSYLNCTLANALALRNKETILKLALEVL